MKEIFFTIKYKNVEINCKMMNYNYDYDVLFYNRINGQYVENVEQTFTGWKFEDDELNKEYIELMEIVNSNEKLHEYIKEVENGELINIKPIYNTYNEIISYEITYEKGD